MRESFMISGTLRRATVREAISSRVGFEVVDDAAAAVVEGGEVADRGEGAEEPFCSRGGDADVRELMSVVACRLAGLAVEMETVRMRDLNLVLLRSSAA